MTILQVTLAALPFVSGLVALGVAVFVFFHNRRAWPNRLLAAGMTALGLHQIALGSALVAPSAPWLFASIRAALVLAALLPPLWLAFGLTFGEKNGAIQLVRWRPVLVLLCLIAAVAWVFLGSGRLVVPIRPLGTPSLYVGIDSWGKAFFSVLLLGLALVLLQLENLYRQADRITRWRVKFLVVGVFVAFGTQIVALSYGLLYEVLHPWHPTLSSLGFLVGELLIAFSLLRHRLLQVDVFISRYVVYRSLTFVVVGGYLVALGALGEVVRWFGFQFDLATTLLLGTIGATGVALLLLSDAVRRRIQAFLHTHFFSHKYDYRTEWMEFTRRLSRVGSVSEIAMQTLNRIIEVMWVRRAAVYVQDASPAGMTLAYQVEFEDLPKRLDLTDATREALHREARRLASAAGADDPADLGNSLSRSVFGETPVGYLVPVLAHDALTGLLVVGPELSGKPFGRDDRDLLVAVAAQAGALIVNERLSQAASEGRELQAMARVATFVVHDLKNAASTLAMLTDNAKLYLHKPEFQADMVRTVEDVVARMRKLLATLSSPATRIDVRVRPTSLGPAVEDWVREIAPQVPSRIKLETRIGPTPEVLIDLEQFRSVAQNLLLNAIEAIPDQGTILIKTEAAEGFAVFTVSDTGRGMSPDFVLHRLFRPFQTTKVRGLGIGLYQCRQIVQQFGGNLTVESEEGKGTCMIVRLPIVPSPIQGPQPPIGSPPPCKRDATVCA